MVTQARIIEWNKRFDGNVFVSFSGGKDSTVLLDLVRRVCADIPAVFVDTGLEYPENREFVKGFSNIEWLRPKYPFFEIIEKYGYPVISKEVSNVIDGARKGQQYRIKRINGELLDSNGNIDASKLRPITYDPVNHNYYVLGEKVGNAFSDGKSLK